MNFDGGESTASTTPRITRRTVLAAAGAAAAVLAACNDDGPYQLKRDPGRGVAWAFIVPNGIVVDVEAIDNLFRPDRIEITSGTEVRWTNRGREAHDVFPVEGSDWGVGTGAFPPGATYSHIFGDVGEVSYYCAVHGQPGFGMIGTIVVVDA
jgi:plastocyanin